MRILIYMWEGVRIAFDALRAYKMRSVLTTLGIIIGVTTVVTIVALIQGLNKAFSDEVSSIGTDTVFIQKFSWMMSGDDWFKYRNRPNIKVEEAEQVRSLSQMATAVAPSLETRRSVKFADKSVDQVIITGTTSDYAVTSNITPENGRFFSENDVTTNRPVCVLGYEVADKLFGRSDPIGKRVSIGGRKFRVVGVLGKKGSFFDFNMDALAIIPVGTFEAAFGAQRRWVSIEVKVKSPDQIEEAEYELTGIMRRLRKLAPDQENNFAINKQSMLLDMYNQLTSTLWAVAIGVGAISLLVGGIGIMNILLVSVTERTREIGIRKALGARRSDILWQFLIESMMICAIGVFIGTVMAIGAAKLVASTTPIPAAITWWVAILGLTFVVCIGLFFGIYPASKAARLNPIESLRYE
jgi:putative ABC transport system permease protein